MMSLLAEANTSGVDRTVKVPVKINGRYDLGPLQCMVTSCLQDQGAGARSTRHDTIAHRAYELYEAGDRHEGDDLRHWFEAERDLVMH
jgi:hypothetical protein